MTRSDGLWSAPQLASVIDRPDTELRQYSGTTTIISLAAISLGFSLRQSLIVPALTTIQRKRKASETSTTGW
jgi:hypothetical protein